LLFTYGLLKREREDRKKGNFFRLWVSYRIIEKKQEGRFMKKIVVLILLMILAAPVLCAEEKAAKPKVEVVFVLDTTGSMGGLIAGAKAKIWYIAEQIVRGKPTPEVKMGLVAYRDKGDAYVTKVFDLTDNIDQVYTDLMDFKAEGGGDTPENVNLALFDAVQKVKWSDDMKALKIIYLVGDSPPHNEYEDIQGYKKTAEEAVKKGIYINTILCGNNEETRKIWKEISDGAEGNFVAIEQGGGVKEIPTPYDDDLAKLNKEMLGTAVIYGSPEKRKEGEAIKESAGGYGGGAAASRAVYAEKTGKTVAGDRDLVEVATDEKTLTDALGKIKEEELPDEMKKMTEAERKKYIEEQKVKRDEASKKIKDISVKRDEYIKKELEKAGGKKDAFDLTVIKSLKDQAEKKGIKYEE
jgi:hypothetical protein